MRAVRDPHCGKVDAGRQVLVQNEWIADPRSRQERVETERPPFDDDSLGVREADRSPRLEHDRARVAEREHERRIGAHPAERPAREREPLDSCAGQRELHRDDRQMTDANSEGAALLPADRGISVDGEVLGDDPAEMVARPHVRRHDDSEGNDSALAGRERDARDPEPEPAADVAAWSRP